jgi:hypothetical protein
MPPGSRIITTSSMQAFRPPRDGRRASEAVIVHLQAPGLDQGVRIRRRVQTEFWNQV